MIMIIMIVKSPKAVPKIMAIPTFDSENTEFTAQFLCIISKVIASVRSHYQQARIFSAFYYQYRKPDSYGIIINSNDFYINDKCGGQ